MSIDTPTDPTVRFKDRHFMALISKQERRIETRDASANNANVHHVIKNTRMGI